MGKLDKLADSILSTNPLLEAFGNAKTVRNNNSSRFGKMMRLHFEATGAVKGAFIKTYLLEKSRTVAITDPERSYHIFYQLMVGASDDAKGAVLGKMSAPDLAVLGQSKCIKLEKFDDKVGYTEVHDSLVKLGTEADKIKELFTVLSALLLLGNVNFKMDDNDKADIDNDDMVKAAEERLGCGALGGMLLQKVLTRGGGGGKRMSTYTIDFTKPQAESARDAVVKSIYTHIFDWIVTKVNGSLLAGGDETSSLPYVGLLDIFGFENFKKNSFEQVDLPATSLPPRCVFPCISSAKL